MSSDPDDGPRREGPADGRGAAGDGDEFDAIVAGWSADGPEPRWPDEAAARRARGDDPAAAAIDRGAVPGGEDHFVPPEPPPLPRLGPPAIVGLAMLGLGVVLCVWPELIGIPNAYGVPLGLVMLAAGLGWLVLRLWPDPPPRGDGHGEDDGAVL